MRYRASKIAYGLLAVLLTTNLIAETHNFSFEIALVQPIAESGKKISPIVRVTLTNISSNPTTIGEGPGFVVQSARALALWSRMAEESI